MLEHFTLLAYLFRHPFGAASTEAPFTISSPAFKTHRAIPERYTCNGKQAFIPVKWTNVPKNTRSLAILMFDEDAPKQNRYHFAAYNIDPNSSGLNQLPTDANSHIAKNSWGEQTYHVPCYSATEHHYNIRLYALDTKLATEKVSTTLQMRQAMRQHTIQHIQLTGIIYPKQKVHT